ncbi:MAG: HAMP domain-containing histidine kinase [Ruminococcus sp.]|nr:HAMP domain-containing histidine kinase [Ruminococcus sp.]
MKLKTKISAVSVGMLLLLSLTFSIWNLSKTQQQIIDNILRYETDRLSEDIWNFNQALKNTDYQSVQGEQYAGLSIFNSISSKRDFRLPYYNTNAVLYYNGQDIYNATPYEFDITDEAIQTRQYPAHTDPGSGKKYISTFLEEINGRHLLILLTGTSDLDFSNNSHQYGRYGAFQILHYRDVSFVYESKWELLFQSLAMSLFLSLLLAAVLLIILKKILVPFYHLRDAANVIAEGNYGKRVESPGTDEVGELSRCFNQMADRVEGHIHTLAKMNEKQRQLIGSLAHELKTPMTGIQGYAELLQRVKLSPERQADALHYIEEECMRLSRLSGKMLQLTELSGEETIEKKSCSIASLFSQAKEITRFRLKEKQMWLEIELEEDLEIECDEDLLLSFITNLIDNACKASPAGSCIRLVGNASGIFVEDSGTGIPEEEIRHITEPFYMVDKSRSRKEGGAGLGLALCQQIARLHGGRLEIRSMPGEGSCIGIVL